MYQTAVLARLPARLAPCPEGWRRTNLLDAAAWRGLTLSLAAAFAALNRRSDIICGPYGEGPAILGDTTIAFNGNLHSHTWRRAALRRDDPSFQGDPAEMDDAHEPFILDRIRDADRHDDDWLHQELATAGKPYTVAVLCALLLMRRHWSATTAITATSSTPAQWQAAIAHIHATTSGPMAMPPELPALFPQRYRPRSAWTTTRTATA